MHHKIAALAAALLPMIVLILITSCESPDRRWAEYADRATVQQARQNDRIAEHSAAVAKQSQEVAAAAHDLVTQDTAARRELIQAHDRLQQDVQAERSLLNRQRDQLASERKAVAAAAVRDPVIARAILAASLIVAALLPLLVTAYALRRLPEPNSVDELWDDGLLESLVRTQTSELARGLQLPAPPSSTTRSLCGPGESPAPGGPTSDA